MMTSPNAATELVSVAEFAEEKSGVRSAAKRIRRKLTWADVAHEAAEYFQYEPRVPSMNTEGGGSGSRPEGRTLSFANGASYAFMTRVYDRLKEADRHMPYICHGKREQPSASMVLRAALGATAAKYDDSAPQGAKLLRKAQEAYAAAANEVGPRVRPSEKDRVLRRFDLVFGGLMTSFPRSDSDDEG